MAININVNGTLYPTDSEEPTHRDIYGEGGYKAVDTIIERDSIPTGLITDGSLVYVRDTNVTYQWNSTLTTWFKYLEKPNNTITEVKMANLSISTRTIQNSAIETAQLADYSVTAIKLDPTALSDYYTSAETEINFYSRDLADDTFLSFNRAPSASTAPGLSGEVAYDSDYFYVCTAPDEWKRVAIATW